MSTVIRTPTLFESDYIRSIGVMPYIPGQVFISADFIENAYLTAYTVPAGKKLYLSNCDISVNGNDGFQYISFYNSGGTVIYRLFRKNGGTGNYPIFINKVFPTPFELIEGDYIYIYCVGDGYQIAVSFYGFIVDA